LERLGTGEPGGTRKACGMTTRYRVGPLGAFPEGEGVRVEVGGIGIALFRRGNRVYAVGDSCPHMGASLSEGYLDGCNVVCPWHGWVFKLEDGSSIFDENACVPVFRVTVEEGEIVVEVDVPASDPIPTTPRAPES
jgi:nitrite reductase/ring-hydroxylating ferredoxin subunit